jgi:signal transduction histidine kinase
VRRRLIVSMVGLVGVVLVAHDVPLAAHLRAIERDRLTTSIERDAFTIGGQISPALSSNDEGRSAAIGGIVDAFFADTSSTVIVVDANGYLIASTDPTHVVGDDYVSRPEVAAALLGNPSSGSRPSVSVGEDLVYVAVPVRSGADVLGAVRITIPKSVLDARVNDRLKGLLVAAAVSIAMAVAVAILLARTVSRPLEELREATDELAAGNLAVVAPEKGPSETRRLAESFNSMAKRLGNMINRQRSFAGDASHQLRTPLTALRLRLEQASESAATDPNLAREHLEEALNETDRLAHLVEQLLQLARAEGAVLGSDSLDLAAVAADRVEHWRYLTAERDIEIDLESPSSCPIDANEVAIREILDNYIDNAIDASSPGSKITVIVAGRADVAEVVVRDSGKGLSSEDRARAFDRFWRASTDSNRRGGSGLGLAVVAQLADAAGLSVELRSSPTGGIDACVSIPRRAQ